MELNQPPPDAPLILVADDVPANVELLFDQLHVLGFRGIAAGGDDFLTKPHNRLVLGARVRSLLKLKAATDAFEESARKMKELEKLRDDLMKMIVHDLKSPLTSVLATIEMLRDGDFGPLQPQQRSALADAEGKADDLLSLINDLLEVRRIEETALPLNAE